MSHRARGLVGALLLGVAACARRDADPAANAKVEIGSPAPSYAATTMTGDSVSLAGLKGKVVLLNVWATWCGPCRKEIPELRAIHASYKDRGLELVGITVDAAGSEDAVRQFTTDFQMAYPIWRDPEERINARYSIVGLPATFLIDRNGILRWKATGPVEPNDTSLASAIGRALGGSSP